jgi:hypothetical protein
MANNDLIQVTASQFDIYSKLLVIAKKYTDINTEDFLKTGLFGYITESMAMIARDSSFHKTMLYNENFLNTAIMPKSVYNWAKMFNINISSATPAYTDILVVMALEDLENPQYLRNYFNDFAASEKYGSEVSSLNKNILILDKSNPFIAGEFYFSLERSILIYKSTDLSDTYTVKYCSTETQGTTDFQGFSKNGNYFIKSSITRTDGIEYLSFVVRVYQYQNTRSTKQITSSSFLDAKIHNFAFKDQFIKARLFYKRGSDPEREIELRFSNIASNSIIDENTEFAYYNLIDSNQLQIVFSSVPGEFIPASNSTIYVDIYTSKGSSGNINYTGDVVFRLREENVRNFPIISRFFNGISVGGIDSPSLTDIKNLVIREISTRDVIVTENDLNNYFLILTALLETINDGKIVFIKKRDDILRRVFSAYILMRDGLDINDETASSGYISKVIPTNTLDAEVAINGNESLKFGSIIKRKSTNVSSFEYLTSAPVGDNDYYIIPFYTRITLSPFRKVKYMYNLTDDSTNLTFKNIVTTSKERYIIPSTVSVYRGIETVRASNYFVFTFNFVTNFNFSEFNQGDIFDVSFYRTESKITPIRTARFNYSPSNTSSTSSKIELVSEVNEDSPGLFNSKAIIYFKVDEEEFDFNITNNTTEDYGTNIIILDSSDSKIKLPENIRVSMNIIGGTNKSLNIEFESGDPLTLFRNLDETMYSDVILNKISPKWDNQITGVTVSTTQPVSPDLNDLWIDSTDDDYILKRYNGTIWVTETNVSVSSTQPLTTVNNSYWINTSNPLNIRLYQYDSSVYINSITVKDIPLVHASFFNSEQSQTKFIKQLFVYINMLKENLGKLETNTFFDLKFYNTYGDSQYYNTPRTDIKLELDIYVPSNLYSLELENRIRDYTRLLVDNSNELNSLRVSDIIKNLTVSFNGIIDHIDFKGLNNTFNQYIEKIPTIRDNLYAPEYLNISKENLQYIKVIQI